VPFAIEAHELGMERDAMDLFVAPSVGFELIYPSSSCDRAAKSALDPRLSKSDSIMV
jgi:hypothetical protein